MNHEHLNSAEKKAIDNYLIKHNKTNSFFHTNVNQETGIIIVIPSYKEPELIKTLESLIKCNAPPCHVEIIVFLNARKTDTKDIREHSKNQYNSLINNSRLKSSWNNLLMHIDLDLQGKNSGVGYVRKSLMDEALFRFTRVNRNGIIVNLDADCLVSEDYLVEIYHHFKRNQETSSCSIGFAHRFDVPDHRNEIIHYETHLRVFIGYQKLLKLPFAFQTIGSAMAVRSLDYAKQGGMNKRQAGEDFYFIHKFVKAGFHTELKTPIVFPSSRSSDRVPFGTGKAIQDTEKGKPIKSYHPFSYHALKPIIQNLKKIYHSENWMNAIHELHPLVISFLKSIKLQAKIEEIKKNTSNYYSFKKRFFRYFDAFKFMKYLHFMRDNGFQNVDVPEVCEAYFKSIGLTFSEDMSLNLIELRNFDELL